nr:hypothetical protein Q903MT_gene2460 [Picea sitchensis]
MFLPQRYGRKGMKQCLFCLLGTWWDFSFIPPVCGYISFLIYWEAEVCKEGLIRGREETGSHKILEYYYIYIYGESSLYLSTIGVRYAVS